MSKINYPTKKQLFKVVFKIVKFLNYFKIKNY